MGIYNYDHPEVDRIYGFHREYLMEFWGSLKIRFYLLQDGRKVGRGCTLIICASGLKGMLELLQKALQGKALQERPGSPDPKCM